MSNDEKLLLLRRALSLKVKGNVDFVETINNINVHIYHPAFNHGYTYCLPRFAIETTHPTTIIDNIINEYKFTILHDYISLG